MDVKRHVYLHTLLLQLIHTQDPNTMKVKKNAIYYDKTLHGNFRGKSSLSSYKTLKQQLNGEK